MAIILKVEEYCHDCPKFVADYNRDGYFKDGKLVEITHTISCERRDLCECLMNHLKEKINDHT